MKKKPALKAKPKAKTAYTVSLIDLLQSAASRAQGCETSMSESETRIALMTGIAKSGVGSRCSLREAHDIVECQITALKAATQAVAPNCDACAPEAPVVDLSRATAPFDTYMDKPGR